MLMRELEMPISQTTGALDGISECKLRNKTVHGPVECNVKCESVKVHTEYIQCVNAIHNMTIAMPSAP